jgi:ketosteroid isomerase-like protein
MLDVMDERPRRVRGEPPTSTEGLDMSGTEMMKGVYEAFGRGDMPAVLGAMDSGIQWREAEGNPYMPSGEAWVGPQAILDNLFVRLAGEWDGFAVHPRSFDDAGDVVTVQGRYTGAYKETGTSIDAQFCHVWTLKDGKITGFQQYTDTAQFQNAMGARSG